MEYLLQASGYLLLALFMLWVWYINKHDRRENNSIRKEEALAFSKWIARNCQKIDINGGEFRWHFIRWPRIWMTEEEMYQQYLQLKRKNEYD